MQRSTVVKTRKYYIGMRVKKKKLVFICQITENTLKVMKYKFSHSGKGKSAGLEAQSISPNIDDRQISERLNQIFKRLGYTGNPVIISLPRSQAICRYLKIPTSAPFEIERAANLQAPRYLPYQPDELVTAYQIISTDREGYSNINLVIVHKNLIERYLKIFKEWGPKKLIVILSSYGLSNLYSHIEPQNISPVMLIDTDSEEIELVIVFQKKLLFSRSFKLNINHPQWEKLFIDEVNKTQDAYLKEISNEAVAKIVIFGENKNSGRFKDALNKHLTLPAEVPFYSQKLNFPKDLCEDISNSNNSFCSLVGLGLGDINESLNLLPQERKEEERKTLQHKEQLKLILFILGIIFTLGSGVAKHLDNKSKCLERLKAELSEIAKVAKPLADMEKRLNHMESGLQKRLSSLDILYELHQTTPTQVSLSNVVCEEDNQLVLRGQTQELNSVFNFVSQLEKSALFKDFNIRVRYATKKKIQVGEVIDFEIICLKK